MGSLSLLQGIFSTQGYDPDLPHGRQMLYQLCHQGSSRLLDWVAISFPGDLPDPGIEQGSPALQEDSLPPEPPGKPRFFSSPLFKKHGNFSNYDLGNRGSIPKEGILIDLSPHTLPQADNTQHTHTQHTHTHTHTTELF